MKSNSSQNNVALPKELAKRLSRDAGLAWDSLQEQPFSFIAQIDKSLDSIPGPEAIDIVNPVVYVAGIVPPIGGTP